MLDAFADRAGTTPDGYIQYTVEGHGARLIALDTVVEGDDAGLLCRDRLEWLEATLAADTATPTMIFMHHPPFDTGVWWMDTAGLDGRAAFRDVVDRHRQVVRIVCGHAHRPIVTGWAGVPVSVGPAVAFSVHLDLAPEERPRAIVEPVACHLHLLSDAGFVTHVTYVDWPREPIDLTRFMHDWDQTKAAWRARKARLR